MSREEILKLCIDTYGIYPQIDMVIEECSELIQALLKHRRTLAAQTQYDHKKTQDNIVEEIADVKIMISQLELIFRCTDEVEKLMDCKLNRQLERIEKIIKMKIVSEKLGEKKE